MNTHLAFVFPGQGSQSVGMLNTLALEYPLIESTFARASAALGYDLWAITQQGPEDTLNQTEITQPALLAASYSLWLVWQSVGGKLPTVMAGHSLGEYSALVCAGALDFEDAIISVADRGRYMQDAVPPGEGAMAAIVGLTDAQVSEICEIATQDSSSPVTPANFNSIGQVVIAGSNQAVEVAVKLATEKGAKLAKRLAVSVPSHCALMQPAAVRFAAALKDLNLISPRIPIINNVDVTAPTDPLAIKDALVRQLASPVRWVETVQKMISDYAITTMVECGPGKVLTGLNKRIDKSLRVISLGEKDGFAEALQI